MTSNRLHRISLVLCILIWLRTVTSTMVNVTIDDTIPDPNTGETWTYAPADGDWRGSDGCTVCLAQPNRSLTVDQTWHDATFDVKTSEVQTASVRFNGKLSSTVLLSFDRVLSISRLRSLCVRDGLRKHYLHHYGGPTIFHRRPALRKLYSYTV